MCLASGCILSVRIVAPVAVAVPRDRVRTSRRPHPCWEALHLLPACTGTIGGVQHECLRRLPREEVPATSGVGVVVVMVMAMAVMMALAMVMAMMAMLQMAVTADAIKSHPRGKVPRDGPPSGPPLSS